MSLLDEFPLTRIRGVRDRPPQDWLQLHHEACRLHHQDKLSYRRIAKILKLPPCTVYDWTDKGSIPPKYLSRINLDPNPSLSYVMGAVLGDGTCYITKDRYPLYRVGFKVKDKDFMEFFHKCIENILGPHRYREYRGYYCMYFTSKHLYKCIKNLETVRAVAIKFPKEFIRGLMDAEGSVSCWIRSHRKTYQARIQFTNTNLVLISILHDLLLKLGIETRLQKQRKPLKNRKQCFDLQITKKKHIVAFLKEIGFTIQRKQEALERAICLATGSQNDSS